MASRRAGEAGRRRRVDRNAAGSGAARLPFAVSRLLDVREPGLRRLSSPCITHSKGQTLSKQDDLYADAVAAYGSALGRLARGYEVDGERRRDLLQDIHLALWQSLD